jgi:hypothetical protein
VQMPSIIVSRTMTAVLFPEGLFGSMLSVVNRAATRLCEEPISQQFRAGPIT